MLQFTNMQVISYAVKYDIFFFYFKMSENEWQCFPLQIIIINYKIDLTKGSLVNALV